MENISKKIKKLDLKQNAIKILINSIYGAFGNKWFYFYNPDIAQSITLQGQDLIKFSIKAVNHYFQEKWHLDQELHEILGILDCEISKITEEAAIYTDTDSVAADTVILSKMFGNLTIEDYYNLNKENGSAGETLAGHESVFSANDFVLNWSNEKGLYHAPVKRIIRHKVTKEKWRLTTESGKTVVVTGDHSLIVFRNGQKLVITAKEINVETDKVLVVIY
jgi:DNA polymerase elongation subunit (family B)